jgi:hypothetical protein
VRLTLRTLLAYLDDTLEPGEIKQIGQKVAESDAAQELIARIKQVTRRRRLTTPPDGGPGERFDANLVAEYLDNELSSEQVAELEKNCLESDVHLAEISACHQILTLVLGEPALIPPTARRRMYALVHGRKKVTARKAGAPAVGDSQVIDGESDETLLIGLPLFRKAPWLRWVVPLAAVLLLAVLGGVLWKTLSGDGRDNARVASTGSQGNGTDSEKDKDKPPPPKDKDKPPPKDKDKPPPPKDKDKPPPKDKDKPPPPKDKNGSGGNGGVKPIPPPMGKPNMEQHPAGKFVSKGEVLVRQAREGGDWQRVAINTDVSTGQTLVSLPSYKSEIRTNKGVRLLLWGNLPEFFPQPLLESAVVLHHNPEVDLELTLKRGRIYLTNEKDKGPAHVRLRFWREEVLDFTLEDPSTTVAVELQSAYLPVLRPLEGEEPLVAVFLYIARGQAQLKVLGRDGAVYRTHGDLKGPPGRAFFIWNNKGAGLEGPEFRPVAIPQFSATMPVPMNPEARALRAAHDELSSVLVKDKKVDVALMELIDSKDATAPQRILGIRSLGAIDDIKDLFDALGDTEPNHYDKRREALFTLKTWLGRGAEQAARLFDRKNKTGLLIDRGFSPETAEVILELLYGPSAEARKQPETYSALIAYLKHERLEVRELAIWNLYYLVPERGRKIPYNPAGNTDQLNAAYEGWKKLIPEGTVPPEQAGRPAPPGPAKPPGMP